MISLVAFLVAAFQLANAQMLGMGMNPMLPMVGGGMGMGMPIGMPIGGIANTSPQVAEGCGKPKCKVEPAKPAGCAKPKCDAKKKPAQTSAPVGLPFMGMGMPIGMPIGGIANTSPQVADAKKKPAQTSAPVGLPFMGMGMRMPGFSTGLSYGARPRGQGLYLGLRRDKYPIHGGFSPWGGYSACSAVCGGGFMTRRRYCNNPIPQNGGLPCMGVRVQTVRCNTHQCPVRGNWGPWSEYSQCSAASCGMQGFQRRTRNCNNPPAMFGGLTCKGPAFQDRVCSFCPASNIGNSGMGGQCLDHDIIACRKWAGAGYCSSKIYYSFMSQRCCAACKATLAEQGKTKPAVSTGVVGPAVQPAPVQPAVVVAPGGTTGGSTGGTAPATGTGTAPAGGNTGGTKPAPGTGTAPGGGSTGGTGGTACEGDKEAGCAQWAAAGLCNNKEYMAYMIRKCCKSCNVPTSANIREQLLESHQLKYKKEVYLMRIAAALKKKMAETKAETK